jgi:hypothetical protein
MRSLLLNPTNPNHNHAMKRTIPTLVVSIILASSAFLHAQDSENLLQDLSFKFQKVDPLATFSGALAPATDSEPKDDESILLEGFVNMTSVQQIPVDPEKSYELSGWFKSTGAKPSKLYFGLRALDEGGIDIWPSQICWVADTDTVLTANASIGDTTVKIKNGANWQAGKEKFIAFKTDPTGNMDDLPNRNLVGIESVQQSGDHWEAKLASPLTEDFPAATPVRHHAIYAGVHIYCGGASGVEVPFEWTFYRGTIRGEVKVAAQTAFWPKTRLVSIVVGGNYMEGPDVSLLVGGLKFREN